MPATLPELPDFPAAVTDKLATECAKYDRFGLMRVCPTWIETAARVKLRPFLRLLQETGGQPFYAGKGLVCEWDADEGVLYVTKTH